MEKREMNQELVELKEVKLEEVESLEETLAPAFGIFCGGGCWGIGCAF